MGKSKAKNKKRRQDRAKVRLEPKPISLADQIEPAISNAPVGATPRGCPSSAAKGGQARGPAPTPIGVTDDLPPLSPMGIEIANRWGKNGLADFERIRRT